MSIEVILFLARMSDEAYELLISIMDEFEKGSLKDMKVATKKRKGNNIDTSIRRCSASCFKNLRNLKDCEVVHLLTEVETKVSSIKEMSVEAVAIKDFKEVQIAMVNALGMESWAEVHEK